MGQMAGIEDCYTSARGSTGTLGNFAKATYAAIAKTYSYLTPDLWKETVFTKSPYQEFTDFLAKTTDPLEPKLKSKKLNNTKLPKSYVFQDFCYTRIKLPFFLKKKKKKKKKK